MEAFGIDLWGAATVAELPAGIAVGAFIFMFLLMGTALGFWHRRRVQSKNPIPGSNLFLKVDYLPDSVQESRRGYLRSLTLERASIVAPDRNLERGANVNLVLHPEEDIPALAGKVVKRKSLGGSPENWLFDVRFTDKSAPANQAIKKYLQKILHGQFPES